jgi:uncharacterized protein YkwD
MPGGAAKALVCLSIAAVAAFAGSTGASSAQSKRAASVTSVSRGVLAEVNTLRRSHGLAPLRLSASLTAAAMQHSREMAGKGYFAHESADGSAFDKRVVRYYGVGRYRLWSVGENLVWASPDLAASRALQLWLQSPPHRKNLLTARWREIGIAAVHVDAAPGAFGGTPATIVTADFGVRR